MRYPLSSYWKAILSGVGTVALAAQTWTNDHGVPNHWSSSEKWSILIAVLTTASVYGKRNKPYPTTQ